MSQQQVQFQIPKLTPVVKKLIIINVAVWVIGVLIIQQYFFEKDNLFLWFGLQPVTIFAKFWLWEFFTYMFLHSNSLFHVLFNMLMLWMLGSELEQRWGSRFFFIYYMVCGVGAGILYTLIMGVYYLITKNGVPLYSPVVGASGAVYGLFLAYGIIFADRLIYFFGIFPLKAKYFVMILGVIELLSLLSSGFSSEVANLAHLGGVIVGFLFLTFWVRNKGQRLRKKTNRHGRKLKLVVDNDKNSREPKYWN